MSLADDYRELEETIRLYDPAASHSGIRFLPQWRKVPELTLGVECLFITCEFSGRRARVFGVTAEEVLKEAKLWFENQILMIEEINK